jgi:hypothetical protein
VNCASAEDLLERLHAFHPGWQGSPAKWIFRGQETDLPLRAAAHRIPSPYPRFKVNETRNPAATSRDNRTYAEGVLIARFLRQVNAAGLELPSQHLLHMHHHPCRENDLALAQHNGIPTSLLDWSTQSYKAAYFAAADAAEDKTPADKLVGDRLVVWSLRRDACIYAAPSTEQIKVLDDIPTSSNPNIRAQSGLFTQLWAEQEILPLEDFMVKTPNPSLAPLPWMRKFLAPRACAGKLLRLLSQVGINGVTMFPGHYGAAKALREAALWDVPNEGA